MSEHSIAALREDYRQSALLETELPASPLVLFTKWFEEAQSALVKEPNAMVLSTVDSELCADARVVLLKGIEAAENGFVFYTNLESAKSKQLLQNPKAHLLFAWLDLERQVRIKGTVLKVSDAKSTAYFDSRPMASKLGAWASAQSNVIASRELMDAKYYELEKTFEGKEITKPPFWGGWQINARSIEFWQGRTSRLHDRILYVKHGDEWQIIRLQP